VNGTARNFRKKFFEAKHTKDSKDLAISGQINKTQTKIFVKTFFFKKANPHFTPYTTFKSKVTRA
jgi:hypothetical protein